MNSIPMETRMKAMGQRIKELRENAHLTQGELAEKVYVSREMMCYIENGRRYPIIDVLIAIADLFDVSLDYLCGRAGKQRVVRVSDEELLHERRPNEP